MILLGLGLCSHPYRQVYCGIMMGTVVSHNDTFSTNDCQRAVSKEFRRSGHVEDAGLYGTGIRIFIFVCEYGLHLRALSMGFFPNGAINWTHPHCGKGPQGHEHYITSTSAFPHQLVLVSTRHRSKHLGSWWTLKTDSSCLDHPPFRTSLHRPTFLLLSKPPNPLYHMEYVGDRTKLISVLKSFARVGRMDGFILSVAQPLGCGVHLWRASARWNGLSSLLQS